MAITLRNTKGTALTHTELDANFTTLQDADLDSAAVLLIAQTADANIPESAVTAHEAAITITESQISDFGAYITTVAFADLTGKPTTIAGYGITDAFTEVSEDTTPQLGGDLDVNGNTIQHTFTLGANGSTDYTFSDAGNVWFPTTENDPVLYLRRGEQYVFVNNSGGGHPFEIRVSNGGAAYSTGVTNNGAASGNIVFKVPMSAPSTLYYQCTSHSGMGNTINIV